MPRDPYPTSPRRQQPSYPTPYWVPTGVPGIYNYVPFGAATPPPGTGTAAPYRPMPRGTPGGSNPPATGGAQPQSIAPTTAAAAGHYWDPAVYGAMRGWVERMGEMNAPAGWYSGQGRLYGSGAAGTLGSYNAAGQWEPALTATYYDPNYGNPATYSGYTFRRPRGSPRLIGKNLTPEEIQNAQNALRTDKSWHEEVPGRLYPRKSQKSKGKGGKKGKKARVGTAPSWTSAVAQFNV